MRSHPARGAWIEIRKNLEYWDNWQGRTPQGVRGLKFIFHNIFLQFNLSHPARGAWIEIHDIRYPEQIGNVAPRKGCVD